MLDPNSEAKFLDYLGNSPRADRQNRADQNSIVVEIAREALECLQTADQRAYQFGFWETVTGRNALQVRLNQYAELTNEDIKSAVQNLVVKERTRLGHRTAHA